MKMEAKQVILTRGLPKTGQSISYQTGDDGYYQVGWWVGKSIANNRTRFISKAIDGDDIVVDNATGLMWAADWNEAGGDGGIERVWETAIERALSLNFAGFIGWRLPNISELLSLVDRSIYNPAIPEPPFINMPGEIQIWSSTAFLVAPDIYWALNSWDGSIIAAPKAQSYRIVAVRGGK